MPLGPKPALESLAKGLNPLLLRQFVRDLLGERGFREMRDFDGVGDGGRDLEAIDPTGKPCVIQLKYRENPEATTSSNEFAELPISLLRLGRTQGLFITNGRITSPAKRDAINSYPGLELGFMEGIDLLEALDRAPLTAALWISEMEIRYIQRRASFGIVCRAFPQDKSCFLDQMKEIVTPPNWVNILGKEKVVTATLKRAYFEYPDFEPFRPPTLLPMYEGSLSKLVATEFNIHGNWTIDQLPQIQTTIGTHIASKWSGSQDSSELCSVRVSRPTLSVTGSIDIVRPKLEPLTVVGRGGETWLEKDIIRRNLEVWEKPSWIQMYQVVCGLYYLLWTDTDLLCKLSYTATISRAELGMALERRAHFDRWWERSIFCYSDEPIPTDRESSDPLAPNFCYPWYNSQWILTWLHPRLQGGIRRGLFGDERDGDYNPFAETPEETVYLQRVLNLVSSKKLERIEPRVAYHANCIATGGEAAPSTMWRTWGTGDLVEYTNEISSPIDFFDIKCRYAAAYIFENSALAKTAVQRLESWDDQYWQISAEYPSSLEEDCQSIQFLAGTVDRSLDTRTILVNVKRKTHNRLLLQEQLKQDAYNLLDLFVRLEEDCALLHGMRQSRQWLRKRWRVYYSPEYPSPGDEQVFFRQR